METTINNPKYCYLNGVYGIRVGFVNITIPGTRIKSVNGKHLEGKSNDDVIWIRFRTTKTDYFPRGLSQLFPGLQKLFFVSCTLKEVSKPDLIGLEKLKELMIENCLLTTLPDDLFENMQNLTYVDLSNNIIKISSSNFLKPLIGRLVMSVDLSGNVNFDDCFCLWRTTLVDFMRKIDDQCKTEAKQIDERFSKQTIDYSTKIKSLWKSGCLSDFSIIAGSKTFPVHRLVLSTLSSVFEKIFVDNDQATEMKIEDFSEAAVENLLHFMYTSEIKETDKKTEMFSIAAKLDVQELKKFYEKVLEKKLTTCSELEAHEIFLVAHQNSCENLKLRTFQAIEKLFGKSIPEDLLKNPERLKVIIDKKIELDQLLSE